MFNLATTYYNGDGVSIDDQQAYAWVLAAGDAGYPTISEALSHIQISAPDVARAQIKLGLMYASQDLPPNPSATLKWLLEPAKQGNPQAQTGLGAMYLANNGGRAASPEGLMWCEKAMKKKFSPAFFCMGLAHEKGLATKQDLKSAAKWYRKAAELGNGDAMAKLGDMYIQGEGVPQDDILAAMWLMLADSCHVPSGSAALNVVSARLNDQQRAKAQKMALKSRACTLASDTFLGNAQKR